MEDEYKITSTWSNTLLDLTLSDPEGSQVYFQFGAGRFTFRILNTKKKIVKKPTNKQQFKILKKQKHMPWRYGVLFPRINPLHSFQENGLYGRTMDVWWTRTRDTNVSDTTKQS